MKADEKLKVTRFTVEILENGFTTETYAYNPYGSSLERKNIRETTTDVLQDFFGVIASNEQIEAERQAEKKAKAEE